MNRTAFLAAALAAALVATPALAQTTITFDDLPSTGGIGTIPTPYFGFTWTNIGYSTGGGGVVSGNNAGVTTDFVATVVPVSGRFNFISAYFTELSGFPQLTVTGFNGATVVGTQSFTLNTTPTLLTFNYDGLTALEIDTEDFTGIDNFTFSGLGTSFSTMENLNGNQRGVAASIDRASTGGAPNNNFNTVSDALQALAPNALPAAFDELSPVVFSNWSSVTAANNASFETQAMDDYLASQHSGPNGAFAAGNGQIDSSGLVLNSPGVDPTLTMIHSRLLAWDPAPATDTVNDSIAPLLGGVDMKDMKEIKASASNPWNFFVRGSVILGQGLSQDDVSHFDDNTESVVVGADYRVSPHFLVGVDAAYAHTDVTLDDNGSSATVDSYSPGIYASYSDGGWYANFMANYLRNNYTQDRDIAFLSQQATSSPTGNEGTGDLDAGYDFHFGSVTVGPLAGVQYEHLTLNSYSESNSAAALDVAEQQSDSLRSRLGFNFRYDLRDGDTIITPRLTATWQHEFLSQDRGVTSQFNGFGGGEFINRTPNGSDDSALIDAGVDAAFSRSVTLYFDYMVQTGQDNYFGQSIQGGVKVGF